MQGSLGFSNIPTLKQSLKIEVIIEGTVRLGQPS